MSSVSKHDTLLAKLKSNPKDFTYNDAKTLLSHFGYVEYNRGRTSGSAVMFHNPNANLTIRLHKPHPSKILKPYHVKQLLNHLQDNGLL